MDRARTQIHAIDLAGLIGPVRTGVRQLGDRLDQLSAELTALVAADNAALKPPAPPGALSERGSSGRPRREASGAVGR